MPGLLDLPEKLRIRIFATILPQNLAIDVAIPFRVRHPLFHVSSTVQNDALAAFARCNKFYLWTYGSDLENDKPKLYLPWRSFLSHITRIHIIIRARTLSTITSNLGTAKLVLDGARLAKWIYNFESLELLVIGIPKVAPPERINEDMLLRFFNHVRTPALVVVDGELSEGSKRQLQKTIATAEGEHRCHQYVSGSH